jgi:hypothetical protein
MERLVSSLAAVPSTAHRLLDTSIRTPIQPTRATFPPLTPTSGTAPSVAAPSRYLYGQQLGELPGAYELTLKRLDQRVAAYVVVITWRFDHSFGDIEVWNHR